MGVGEDVPSLLALAREYIRTKYNKPGNVYLGVVSRLDAPVTGATLLARTSKAAARLSEQFRERDVTKIYWALVEGRVGAPSAALVDWVRKDERHRRMHIAQPGAPGAQEARLSFRTLQNFSDATLLEVQLETGRKHQIRVQLAEHGCPVLGDRKYGGVRRFASGIALHARRLAFAHPTRDETIEIEAPLPDAWRPWAT
ncbi:MAG: RNA pseudouridine synthase [Planctomycetales bacterium]|nr:RNA pseudouridine synthase [Planctomycetales bacterium]